MGPACLWRPRIRRTSIDRGRPVGVCGGRFARSRSRSRSAVAPPEAQEWRSDLLLQQVEERFPSRRCRAGRDSAHRSRPGGAGSGRGGTSGCGTGPMVGVHHPAGDLATHLESARTTRFDFIPESFEYPTILFPNTPLARRGKAYPGRSCVYAGEPELVRAVSGELVRYSRRRISGHVRHPGRRPRPRASDPHPSPLRLPELESGAARRDGGDGRDGTRSGLDVDEFAEGRRR